MPIRLQWRDDLDAVAADAGGALDRAAQPRLFDRMDWFRAIVAHGLAGPALVLRAADGDDAAWLFFAREGHRRAVPLASWYTLAFAPVLHGSGARLLPALFQGAGRRLDVLTIAPVRDGDLAAIRAALDAGGWASFVHRTSASRTATVDRADFAAWWATRPPRLRNTVARRRRSHPLAIAIHDRFSAEAWDAYDEVYRASWKPAEGSMPFLRALAEREGAAGTLRLGIARDPAGRPVAAQLWLVENGVATIHKLAHREDARTGSPGSILSAALFEHVIDRDGVRTLDFGLGDEPYKADWMDAVAPVWRIDAYRRGSLRGLAGMARERLARLARRVSGG